MDDIIKLNSRRENNYLKKLNRADNSESKTYLLKTESSTLRSGRFEDGKEFIDPSGGPMIITGVLLEEANAVVKSIDHICGYGYTITFK